MKRNFLVSSLVTIALFGMFFISCKKSSGSVSPSYKCTGCITTPEAVAANDNSSKGIYKGIIVGSSGTIKFDIMNSDATIKAYMVVDGVSDTLTASVAWVSGVSYVSAFTGTFNGQAVSITMSLDANGGNPTITAMNIPGHPNATLTISKETSSNLVECFEGTYTNATTGKNGTLNLIISPGLNKWYGQARETGSGSSQNMVGTISNNTLSYDDGHGFTVTGTLSGDQTNGTWKDSQPENGTWTAKRTL